MNSLEHLKYLFLKTLDQGTLLSPKEVFEEYETLGASSHLVRDQFKNWYDKLTDLSFLGPYLNQSPLYEIILHFPQIQIESAEGKQTIVNNDLNLNDFKACIQILCIRAEVEWSYSKPFQSFSLKINGHQMRATCLHESLSPYQRPKLFLRMMSINTPNLSSYFTQQEPSELITQEIIQKKNILICGATGSGKTTFLRSCLNQTEENEHIVVLEDTHEITLNRPTISYLLSDSRNKEKSLNQYCSYAMRIRPDRIILGEIRSEEVVPFTMAMNTGHRGLLATLHADSGRDALMRMALLFCLFSPGPQIQFSTALGLICRSLDYVIYLENKKVTEIVKVLGSEGDQCFIESCL